MDNSHSISRNSNIQCLCGFIVNEFCSLWITCDICKSSFHSACVLLTDLEVQDIINKNEKWYCGLNTCKEIQYQNKNAKQAQSKNSGVELVSCNRCPQDKQNKLYKGTKGLKIHYSLVHLNDTLSDSNGHQDVAMGDFTGGSKNKIIDSIDFSIDGTQSLEFQNYLQSNQSDFKCTTCNRLFTSSKGLKIHLSHHKKLTDKINSQKLKRKKGYRNENSIELNNYENGMERMNDLKEFLNLNYDENKLKEDSHTSINTDSRVSCNVCGFLSKNERGLKIHMNLHKKIVSSVNNSCTIPKRTTKDNQIDLKLFGILLNKCKNSIPIIRIIQKSVRSTVCQELTNVIRDVVNTKNVNSWLRLLSFPYIVLNSFKKEKNGPNVIRTNLKNFIQTDNINDELLKILKKVPAVKGTKSKNNEDLTLKTVKRKIGEGDISGAVRVLCSEESIAPYSVETIDKLISKHPDEMGILEESTSIEVDIKPTETYQVSHAINNFPNSSAGGVDGLKPRHLKDLISYTCGDNGLKLQSTIANFVDIIRNGKIISDVLPIFYGATLTALSKKKDDIRPIAVGTVWRRLAAKIAVFDVSKELSEMLRPFKFGFGIRGGSEAIIHAVRCLIESNHDGPMAIIKLDYKNAFNMLFRKHLLNEVKSVCPKLYPMLQQAYRCPSYLYYMQELIMSKRGVQQGDPLGPLSFCIGIMKLTHSLTSRLNSWYLDDGTLGDNIESLKVNIKQVKEFCVESGLCLNTEKCEIYIFNANDETKESIFSEITNMLPDIRKLYDSSLEILGAPIMKEGLIRMLSSKIESVKVMCNRLKNLDVHQALCLFRHSLSSPRFIHLLRTSPTFVIENILQETDELFRTTLESISNTKIDGHKWLQASLPISLGGLGIRRLQDLSYPAYCSSLHSSAHLSNLILQKFNLNIMDKCIQYSIVGKYIPESDESKKIQEEWDLPNMKEVFEGLLNSSEPVDRARLLASLKNESSKWLHVVPSSQLGLFLDNNSVRIAIALRLGCQICEKHQCICGTMVDTNGHHGLSCMKTGGHYSRHVDLNKIISNSVSSARIPNILEPPGLSRDDGRKPDGMSLIPWSHGKAILWDSTVRNTLAASYLHCSSKIAGSVADNAERIKHNHYRELKNNYNFTPVAFETLGPMGPDTKSFLTQLGKLIKKETGEARSLDFLLQKISISIQRGNAACVLGTFGKNFRDNFML